MQQIANNFKCKTDQLSHVLSLFYPIINPASILVMLFSSDYPAPVYNEFFHQSNFQLGHVILIPLFSF